MVFNLTLCKSCQKKLVNTLQFVRLKSLYTVLGVSPTASQKEIRDAYIKLSKENHPDQNRDDKKSHEKFVLIKEAYETLSKDISRRDYDMKLRKPSAYPRSPNYYSSGDFYQDQQHHGPFSHGPYGSETSGGYHYNPYTNRAHQQQAHDPFSEYNYEYYQRQRTKAKEEEKPKNWHGTRTEPKPKPKGADDYRMINFFKGIMFGMIFLMGASVAYEIFISVQIQMLKREVERRKLKKQQDEHMAMSKPHSQRVEESS